MPPPPKNRRICSLLSVAALFSIWGLILPSCQLKLISKSSDAAYQWSQTPSTTSTLLLDPHSIPPQKEAVTNKNTTQQSNTPTTIPFTITTPNNNNSRGVAYKKPTRRKYIPRPTFLWGIPCLKDDMEQRQLLRETYLSFYQDTDDDEPHRICKLADLQTHKVSLHTDCQLAYVFFVGGNPQGPTELVQPNETSPMVMTDNPSNHHHQEEEDDVIYLNIRENLEDGKSQTWFKYASMVVQEQGFAFDYIAKVDSDTLLFTPAFLRFAQANLPVAPNNVRVYGGCPNFKNACVKNESFDTDAHPCPLPLVGGSYMRGSLYWMSPDLAEFITSSQLNRTHLQIRHEDVDIGNFVFTHPKHVSIVRVHTSNLLIHRSVDGLWMKRNNRFTFWNIFWGHSHDGMWPGPLFKDRRFYRKLWNQFQAFWYSHKQLQTHDIYALYDQPNNDINKELIRTNDYIFSKQDFDSSPIVLERYKLVFFTVAGVGDVTWRCLFRRMMGHSDWQNTTRQLDGLSYLYEFNVQEATTMMTSTEYTRAMFVRDPEQRILSSYLETVVKGNGTYFRQACCPFEGGGDEDKDCVPQARNISKFLKLTSVCDDPYWRPQSRKMEPKYYPLLNFIGHYETAKEDAQRLLQRIGGWDEYGQTGWGEDGTQAIFHQVPTMDESLVPSYGFSAREKLEEHYKIDYEHPSLHLTRQN